MDSSDSRSGSVWAVAIVFMVSTWVTVLLRAYVRVEQLGKFGVDDMLVCVAQLFFTGYLICQMAGAAYGTGRHLADLELWSAETALRFWFFCEVWYSLATTCVKVAICLSLRRVTVKQIHIFIIYGLIIWSVALGLAFFLGIIFQCIPTSDWWDLDPSHKHCLEPHVITSLTYTVSALNVACDWTLGIFPFFIVKDLDIPIYQKALVASILAFGALASTATIVRMVYIPTLEQTYAGWNGDFLYDTTPVAIWTTIEVGVAITAICLATLRPLVKTVLWRMGFSSNGSYYNSNAEQEPPIPLGIANYDKAFDGDLSNRNHFNATRPIDVESFSSNQFNTTRPLDDFSSASHFNATRPLDDFSKASHFNATRPLDDDFGSTSTFNATRPLDDDFAKSTHFNATRPIDSAYDEPGSVQNIVALQDQYRHVTRMNTTRPLSSSFSEHDEDAYQNQTFRRHAPG